MSIATLTRSIRSIGTPFFLRKRFCKGHCWCQLSLTTENKLQAHSLQKY